MTRYVSQITLGNDGTSKAAWNCTRSVTANPGVCVFQLTGGVGGCSTNGSTAVTTGAGCCCQWTVPTGVSSVVIEIWGGGGGGAAMPNGACGSPGQGGGGGAYSRKTLAVTGGSLYTICVGAGGAPGTPSTFSRCCCGLVGGTTYVTGTGLTNFCANGGFGGESRCYSDYNPLQLSNGGWPGSGGDLNLRGGDGYAWSPDFCCGYTYGGYSPFGGRQIYSGFDYCSQYTDAVGNNRAGGPCGQTGHFPGGGGSGAWPSCCCGVCSCGGPGAPGLIRIWM